MPHNRLDPIPEVPAQYREALDRLNLTTERERELIAHITAIAEQVIDNLLKR